MVSRRLFLVGSIASIALASLTPSGVPFPTIPCAEAKPSQVNDTGLAEHHGWILTVSDKKEIANAAEAQFEIRESIDILGADLHEMKVLNPGQCAEACSIRPECLSFTYAKPSHPLPQKQNSCWLKSSKSAPQKENDSYISGVRR